MWSGESAGGGPLSRSTRTTAAGRTRTAVVTTGVAETTVRLGGTMLRVAAAVTSSARMTHSVAHPGMSAETTGCVARWCWQHGIVQAVSAAYRGSAKKTPTNTSTATPENSRIVIPDDKIRLWTIPCSTFTHDLV